jgi:hypothetical protein
VDDHRNYKIKDSFDLVLSSLRNSRLNLKDVLNVLQSSTSKDLNNPDHARMSSTMYLVIGEHKLGELLTNLGRRLSQWCLEEKQHRIGGSLVADHSIQALCLASDQEVKILQKELKQAIATVGEDDESFRLEKIDQQHKLVLQVQDRRENVQRLKHRLKHREETWRQTVRSELEPHLYQLAMEVVHTSQRLETARAEMQWQVTTHYNNIRKAELERMVQSASAPYNVKRKALKEITKEENVFVKKKEAFEYEKAMSKVKGVYQIKQLMTKSVFESTMRDVVGKMHTHSLLNALGDAKACQAALNTALESSKSSLWQAQTQENNLTRELSHFTNCKEITDLTAWKQTQTDNMEQLQINAKKLDMLAGIDFERLGVELQRQNVELVRTTKRMAKASMRQQWTEANGRRTLTQLNEKIQREEELIQDITEKTRHLKMKMSAQDRNAAQAEDTLSGGSNSKVQFTWEERAHEKEQKYRALLARNEELRQKLHAVPASNLKHSPKSKHTLRERPYTSHDRDAPTHAPSYPRRPVPFTPPSVPSHPKIPSKYTYRRGGPGGILPPGLRSHLSKAKPRRKTWGATV